MMKVDVLQVFISTSAIFGIGLIWINFNKVFKTFRRLAAAPFSWPNEEDDSSSNCGDEGGFAHVEPEPARATQPKLRKMD